MRADWYKEINPNLDKLAQLLEMAGRPAGSKPSHGYTIAEKAPEVVTAPGVYFPAEKGEIIPLESRQEGGSISPSSPRPEALNKDNDRAKLEMLNFIISNVKPSNLESRQFGGSVIPPQGEMERLGIEQSKYDILKSAISVLKPQGEKKSYNERASAYGSPGWFGSEKSVKGGKPYSMLKPPSSPTTPSLPGIPEPPTAQSYGIQPEATKLGMADKGISEGDLLWQKKRAEAGWTNPTQDLWEHKREEFGKYGHGSTPFIPAQKGVNLIPTVPIDEKDDYEEMRKRFLEQNDPNVYKFNIPPTTGPVYPTQTPETLELAAREKWEKPGYPEERLAEAQKISPNVVAVQPGFQRSYYEAHPEERLMEYIAEANRPVTDMYKKLIEEARTRQQGYGRGFDPTLRERRLGAKEPQYGAEIPALMAGLEKATSIEVPKFEPKKPPTPHLVQNEKGEYVWASPGGILPAGIMGKTQPTKEYEPRSFIKPDGTVGWIKPGQEIPEGWKPYEKSKEIGFKDKMIEKVWPTLTDDEQKRILGARIDPKELTEKNILDVYGNIMTDPTVRKALQPIAEEIIKKTTEKPTGKPPEEKIINELPQNAQFQGYGADGKKIYMIPPSIPGGKTKYIKEK